MNKVELLAQMENCKNYFVLSLAGLSVASDPRGAEILKTKWCKFGGFMIDFGQVIAMFSHVDDRAIATREAVLAAFRALLKECFELVKSYVDDTGQEAKFREFPSYKYHRLVRNALSHNYRWDRMTRKGSPYPYLPLEPWRAELKGRAVTIEASMHDQHMTLDQLPFDAMWQLFVDLDIEVRKSLV